MKAINLVGLLFFVVFLSAGCVTTYRQGNDTTSVSPSPETSPSPPSRFLLAGDVVTTISDGDFVHPRLSPDGSRLAFSRVLIEDVGEYKQENTEIGVLTLKDDKRNVLLNADQARKYSTYASFVFNLEWPSNKILRAYISDGDVDSTRLDFDVTSRKIVGEKFLEPDWDYEKTARKIAPMLRRLSTAFPDEPPEIFDDAISNDRALISGDRVLTQIQHAGFRDDIVLYDIGAEEKKTIIEIPKAHPRRFLGGFVSGTDFVFGVHVGDKIDVFLYRGGELRLIHSQLANSDKDSSVEVKFVSPAKSIFMLTIGGSGGNRESATLWLFEGDQMKWISNYGNIYDFDYSEEAHLAVFCFWESGQRHISVMRVSN